MGPASEKKCATSEGIESCLRGERLYGDDFGPDELRRWFEQEEEGYAGIEDLDLVNGEYGYAGLNEWHAWRIIRGRRKRFAHCVSLGGARGDDVKPLASIVDRFTVIEPSRGFWVSEIGGRPASYLFPRISGELALASGSADLVTSLATLHHIANVSFVIREVARLLAPGGLFVLREPIHAMGDWRNPRNGKTRNERGIPPPLLKSWLREAGFELARVRYCIFAPLDKLRRSSAGRNLWNTRWAAPLDELLCGIFAWNYVYLRTSLLRKIAPGCIYVVARRKGCAEPGLTA